MGVSARISFVVSPSFNRKMPHLGVASLRSYLVARGHETRYHDLSALHYHDRLLAPCLSGLSLGHTRPGTTLYTSLARLLPALRGGDPGDGLEPGSRLLYRDWVRRFAERVLDDHPDLVAFSLYESNFAFSLGIAHAIKSKDSTIPIVFGGPYLVHREVVRLFGELADTVDFMILGEGEHSLAALLDHLANPNRRLPRGCVAAKDASSLDSRPVGIVADLDELPFPDFTGAPFEAYRQNSLRELNFTTCIASSGHDVLPIAFGRGCPFRCSFCGHSPTGVPHRVRSVARVLDELRFLSKRWGVTVLRVNDSMLNMNHRWLHDFCDGLLTSGLKMYWYGHARAAGLGPDLARKMHRAGCRYLKFGVESGSDRMLRIMRKACTAREQEEGVRAAHGVGMKTRTSLIYGFPGEREEDLRDTLGFVERNREAIDRVRPSETVMVPESDLALHPEKYDIDVEELERDHTAGSGEDRRVALPHRWRSREITHEEMGRRKRWFLEAMAAVEPDPGRPFQPPTFPEIVERSLDGNPRLSLPEDMKGRWRHDAWLNAAMHDLDRLGVHIVERLERSDYDLAGLARTVGQPQPKIRRRLPDLMAVGLVRVAHETNA
jgi:radical SAM superfamily enzyme YgiQ (UPF0313 family)